jgi:3-oxoacyl-(acyl-carrier-protein) synthase
VVLEDLETAIARGAKIYGEILGGNVNLEDKEVWVR